MPNDQKISEVELDEEYARLEASLKSCRSVVENYRDRVANDPHVMESQNLEGHSKPD